MAVLAVEQPQAGAVAAAQHTTPAAASAAEQWLHNACRVTLSEDGNVVSHVPQLMACAVQRLIEAARETDEAAYPAVPRCAEPTRLHGCRPPGISIEAYAQRLLRYCKSSPVCYVAAFAYMMRLHTGCGGIRGCRVRIDALTAHRLMAVGCIIAVKFFEDRYYSNAHYAQVAGVSLREWNAMELDMLFRLNFRARVDLPELCGALREMEALACGQPGLSTLLPEGPMAAAAAAGAAAELKAALMPQHPASTASLPALKAVAMTETEGSEGSADTALAAGCSGADVGSEAELQACAASVPETAAAAALLPWATTEAVEAAAGEDVANRTAPPRRSKKRCSTEVARLLTMNLQHMQQHERQRLADALPA